MEKKTRLTLAICLSFTFMLCEIAGGIWANSLAILSDAAHLLTDIAGFAIALLATVMATSPASKNFTFGLARAEVMGALASILTLWVMTGCLIWEASLRSIAFFEGTADPVDGKIMFIVACMGVVVNLCLSCVFLEDHGGAFHSHDHAHGNFHDHGHHDHDHSHSSGACEEGTASHVHGSHNHDSHEHDPSSENEKLIKSHDHSHSSNGHGHSHSPVSSSGGYGSFINVNSPSKNPHAHDHNLTSIEEYSAATEPSDVNIQAAYLHVMTDLIQSVGVAMAGLVIWYKPEWQIIDPICTFMFSGLVIWSTFSLLGRVVSILFEGVPAHVDYHAVLEKLKAIPGVVDVHDLHIWSISSTTTALTCHIRGKEPQVVLAKAIQVCSSFGIHHSTIQVQDDNDGLDLCCQNPSDTQCM